MVPTSPDYVDLVARALQVSFAIKSLYMGDPEFQKVPVEMLISKDYAAQIREKINRKEFFQISVPGRVANMEGSSDTTAISVWDSENNVVSLTHTLGSSSGVVTAGLGFTYNNGMHLFNPFPNYPNSIRPKKRRNSGRASTILMKDGNPVMIIGAPGGTRIVSAILHTILNVIDHKMSAAEAVATPRWHSEGPILIMEARIYWNLEEAMRSRGWENILRSKSSYDRFFARSQCIYLDQGEAYAGGDPRGGGGFGKWPL